MNVTLLCRDFTENVKRVFSPKDVTVMGKDTQSQNTETPNIDIDKLY